MVQIDYTARYAFEFSVTELWAIHGGLLTIAMDETRNPVIREEARLLAFRIANTQPTKA
jgi:hypothetical protein